MRFLRRSLVGLFLLAVTVGLLVFAGSNFYGALQDRMAEDNRRPGARERVFSANVLTVTAQEITPVLETHGELRSRRTLDLRTKTGGTVVTLHENFEEGGVVEAGALLLQVDPADAQSALDRSLADQADAQAELRDAERGLELARDELAAAEAQMDLRSQALARQQDLRQRGVGTDAAVETAALAEAAARSALLSERRALANSETQLELARATLSRQSLLVAEAERDLADTTLYAAFDGALSNVSLVAGGLVTANEQVAQLIDPELLEVTFRVSTAQYARLLDGDGRLQNADVTVALEVLGAELTASGRITRESAAVAEGQTGRLLFARLEDAPGFRPGDFVTVRVKEPELANVTLLPASAVDAAGTVLVLGEDDRLETAEVRVLRRQGDNVIVRASALEGREIVAERTPVLGAGIKINPLRKGAAPVVEEPEMVTLTPERRAKLIAAVENNKRMPQQARDRILAQLAKEQVPAAMIERLERRTGG
ncbi:efflux RND transporter periplasmic adaptor subunit [Actibacterium pelagium]|uniref:HlyD family secretion protein n=1 Tax=Actibacterium pelagium TaxID=2029103 RepID=A0A917AIR3_9RHOB|nr:HlyD family efflux transporter periplasmic adaptor subunit [Actibacterium pelagium]GGE53948.1 hypothetical protein GCM10011517_21970 [Actibacterium pelagium]